MCDIVGSLLSMAEASGGSISVVIPTYNCASLLPVAVKSAFDQTRAPDEVVIVDDGSTDATPGLLRELAARYGDRLTCVRKPNGGEASARNAGVSAARHEFIAFLDCDDRWAPEKLERQMDAFTVDPALDLVFTAYWRVTPQGARSLVCLPDWDPDPLAVWRALIVASSMTPSTVLVRKAALHAVGPFDETMRVSCDWDMWARLAVSGIRTAYLRTPLMDYLWHDANLSRDRRDISHAAQLIFGRLFRSPHLPRGFQAEERRCRSRWHLIHAENTLEAGDGKEATRHVLRAITARPWGIRPGWLRILLRGLFAA